MKTQNLFLFSLAAIVIFSCGGSQGGGQESESDSTAVVEKEPAKEVNAVSIWDKISLREIPSDDGKWLTSLSLGETLIYLGEEQTSSDDKTFLKVRLNDGTEGWCRTEFIVPEADPAVFVNETNIYKRPDLLTKTDDKFFQMDIIAVIQVQDSWAEVKGRPTGEKWFKSGWVKKENLSYGQVDIAMAKFAKPVLTGEIDGDTPGALEDILSNQDLTSSVFTSRIQEKLDSLKSVKLPDLPTKADTMKTE